MTSRTRTLSAFAAGALIAPLLALPASPAFAAGEDTPPPPRSVAEFCQNVPADFEPFTDIDGNTFEDNIECLAFAEITQGQSGGNTYGPGGLVRRDQMASFIARLIDKADELDTGDNIATLPAFDGVVNFTDVPPGNVHRENIDRLAEAGIVTGGPGGRPQTQYGPELEVTRAQMATFIRRGLAFMTGEDISSNRDFFTDDENVEPHEPSINAVAELAIAVGNGQDSFNPLASVTRGQMAGFLTRTLAVLEANEQIRPVGEERPVEENIQVSPDTDATLDAVANPDDSTADDRGYSVSGLVEGEEYRITLVVEENIDENADGETTFVDSDNDNLAETGDRTADITQVNGEPAENNTGDGTARSETDETNGGTAVFTADGSTATFVVDGDQDGESVQPVVYRNGGGSNTSEDGGSSPRLELNDDGTPAEAFDVGGSVTFDEPVALNPAAITDAPDLVSAEFVRNTTNTSGDESTTVRFTFDEDVIAGVSEDAFNLYTFDGEQITTDAGDSRISDPDDARRDTNDESSVLVVFSLSAEDFADVTLATVERGAVEDSDGNENPIGDAALGDGVTFTAGVTEAPDLVSIGNFRPNTATASATLVDFRFDEPAFVTNPATGQFQLVQPDGDDLQGTPVENGATDATGDFEGDGTTTITVSFNDDDTDGDGTTEPVTAASVERGVVLRGAVSDEEQTDDGSSVNGNPVEGAVNPLQVTDGDSGGATTLPDLVSATVDQDESRVTYVFDEDVVVVDPALFQVYDRDGVQTNGTAVSGADNDPDDATVIVTFAAGTLDAVTGASVDEGAVRENGAGGVRLSQEDEVGTSSEPVEAGFTTGPDLTDVNREIETETETDPFTGEATTTVTGVTIRFIFDDEANLPANPSGFEGEFFVVDESGDAFELTGCEEANQTSVEGDENVIVCEVPQDNDPATPGNQGTAEFEAARDAVVGTVESGAVTDDEGTENPEGADDIGGATAPEQGTTAGA